MSFSMERVRLMLPGLLLDKYQLFKIASVVLVLVVWELVIVADVIDTGLLPLPSTVLATTANLLGTGDFRSHISITVYRTVAASVFAVIPGIVLGLLMGWNQRVKAAFYPLLSGIYPLPKIALFPLLMLIFGIGEEAYVATAVIAAVFLILLNAMHGVENVDELYIDIARDNNVTSTYRLFREVLIPATLPRLFTGLRLSISTALVVVISIEFIAASEGIGYFIWVSWSTFTLNNMYAGIVIAGIMGMIITYGLEYLKGYLVPWQEAVST